MVHYIEQHMVNQICRPLLVRGTKLLPFACPECSQSFASQLTVVLCMHSHSFPILQSSSVCVPACYQPLAGCFDLLTGSPWLTNNGFINTEVYSLDSNTLNGTSEKSSRFRPVSRTFENQKKSPGINRRRQNVSQTALPDPN